MESHHNLSYNNRKTIVLADDEPDVREYLDAALRRQGYKVESVQDGEEALDYLHREYTDICAVLLDVVMPRKSGLDTLRQIRELDRDLPVILLSRASSVPDVVDAMKKGATDVLEKPITQEHLSGAITRALAHNGNGTAPERSERTPIIESPLGDMMRVLSFPMKDIDPILPSIAASNVPVLIEGDTGVGKEVLARRIHLQSPRGEKPFLKLNCAALPAELVESELFGYERGAFTGAFQRKPGIFEMADGGTLLLDEIGDMSLRLQAKLLHVLQDGEFHRLGGKERVRVDVRVIAATHCDLKTAMLAKRFRNDLYYRLNVVSVRLPPLRDRKEEIVPLAEFLLRKHANGNAPTSLSPDLRQAFMEYHWPGNIRELENMIRRLLVLQNQKDIARQLREDTVGQYACAGPQTVQRLRATQRERVAPVRASVLDQVNEAKTRAERDAILAALNSTKWNRKEAAGVLKLEYKALLYKMKKLGIEKRRRVGGATAVFTTAAGL